MPKETEAGNGRASKGPFPKKFYAFPSKFCPWSHGSLPHFSPFKPTTALTSPTNLRPTRQPLSLNTLTLTHSVTHSLAYSPPHLIISSTRLHNAPWILNPSLPSPPSHNLLRFRHQPPLPYNHHYHHHHHHHKHQLQLPPSLPSMNLLRLITSNSPHLQAEPVASPAVPPAAPAAPNSKKKT
jgi:hypothetical protein